MKVVEKVIRAVGFEPVSDIAQFRKWWSVKLDAAAIIVGSVAVSYGQLPDDWRAALPHNMVAILAGLGLAIKSASLIARGIKQKPPESGS